MNKLKKICATKKIKKSLGRYLKVNHEELTLKLFVKIETRNLKY